MKNNEIIQIAASLALVGILLYRKYGKKIKSKEVAGNLMTGKSISSKKIEDDYEPYSKKGNQGQN